MTTHFTPKKLNELSQFLKQYSKWNITELLAKQEFIPFDGNQSGGITFNKTKGGRRYIEYSKRCYL